MLHYPSALLGLRPNQELIIILTIRIYQGISNDFSYFLHLCISLSLSFKVRTVELGHLFQTVLCDFNNVLSWYLHSPLTFVKQFCVYNLCSSFSVVLEKLSLQVSSEVLPCSGPLGGSIG